MRRRVCAGLLSLLLMLPHAVLAWGVRGHRAINGAAVDGLPDDGPVFLRAYREWIATRSIVPDTWRLASEPFLKIEEDPNHGWFKEQFSFLKVIPRSRYEFVLALHDEYLKLKDKDPARAKLTNVRWTGTLPYAAVETYERMKAAMRMYRMQKARNADTKFAEMDIAYAMGWLGHYTGDGAMPLHDSVHHDGWQGPNPKGYTTDPRVHGRFESQFVDLIEAKDSDVSPLMAKAKKLEDPFAAILAHLDKAFSHVEAVYQLDLEGAYGKKEHEGARKLVLERLSSGAELLRDLTYTAWLESGAAPPQWNRDPKANPISPENPKYNPATGSAPAPGL